MISTVHPDSPTTGSLLRHCLFACTLLCSTVALPAGVAEERDFDRAAYGAETSSFWSPLTAFEQRVIRDYPKARDGDPDALLALYLLASGDVRTQDGLATRRAVMDSVLQRLSEGADRDPFAAGKQLLAGMHEYLLAGDAASPLAGYAAGQSRLSAVFSEGRYNCISSSLLYIVMARRAGLEANGVILPSHAFVDITLDDGRIIAVETTSPDGYDVHHDRALFESMDSEWFLQRELEVPRYEDYLQRERVSAAALGLENMWNQHTASDRMGYPDRLRLAEIRSHLQPGNRQALLNRMLYYTREAAWLRGNGEMDTLQRLFRHIEALRQQITALAGRGDVPFDNVMVWLEVERAAAMLQGSDPHAGGRLIRQLLLELPAHLPDAERLRHNLYVTLDDYVAWAAGAGELDEAAAVFDGLRTSCIGTAACRQTLLRLHAGLAQRHWAAARWPAVLESYQSYLALTAEESGEVPVQESLRRNMETAWLNWAEQDWFDEYRDEAMERLQQCIDVLDHAPRCRSRLAEWRRDY